MSLVRAGMLVKLAGMLHGIVRLSPWLNPDGLV
jgi:hypothetical protein